MLDAIRAVCHGGGYRCTGFLNERERQLAEAALNKEKWTKYRFYGGYQGAERVMLCVFEDKDDAPLPLAAVGITPLDDKTALNHRDYLGALLAVGIRRDCIGDILVTRQGAVAAVSATVAVHIEQQLAGVGRSPVRVQLLDEMPQAQGAEEDGEAATTSVASLRLDAVLAAMLNVSREKAAGLVKAERVQVNHRLAAAIHQPLAEGDVLSVRGAGRLRLDAVGGTSKKGRTFITYTVYK